MFGSGLGLSEILVILLVGLILFGKRLPEVSRALGRGIREFQRGMRGIEDEIHRAVYAEPGPALPAPPPTQPSPPTPPSSPTTPPPAPGPSGN